MFQTTNQSMFNFQTSKNTASFWAIEGLISAAGRCGNAANAWHSLALKKTNNGAAVWYKETKIIEQVSIYPLDSISIIIHLYPLFFVDAFKFFSEVVVMPTCWGNTHCWNMLSQRLFHHIPCAGKRCIKLKWRRLSSTATSLSWNLSAQSVT